MKSTRQSLMAIHFPFSPSLDNLHVSVLEPSKTTLLVDMVLQCPYLVALIPCSF